MGTTVRSRDLALSIEDVPYRPQRVPVLAEHSLPKEMMCLITRQQNS